MINYIKQNKLLTLAFCFRTKSLELVSCCNRPYNASIIGYSDNYIRVNGIGKNYELCFEMAKDNAIELKRQFGT